MKFLKILLIIIIGLVVLFGILLLVDYFLFMDDLDYGYYEDDYDDTYEMSDDYYEDDIQNDSYEESDDTSYAAPTLNNIDSEKNMDVLIVLVDFKDEEITTDEKNWYNLFWGDGKTVSNYFGDMSKGNLAVIPVNETYGTENDGIICVSADIKHPNIDQDASERKFDKGTQVFEQAIEDMDYYIDFSDYDDNGDGKIQSDEIVMVMVYAGYEQNEFSYRENQSSAVQISDYGTYADDVDVSDYIIYGELTMEQDGTSHISTMGTICHEMAHALGLPDLYDTDYSSMGLGFHSLMSEGNDNSVSNEYLGTTPAPVTAWEREYLGFIEPQTVKSSGTYTLNAQSTDEYNILRIDTGDVYYLLENIDFNGYGSGLDTYMNKSGIAIWRVDKKIVTEDNLYNNIINDDDNNRGVSLMEAGGTRELFKENLDYDRQDYDHYFSKGYYDELVLEDGTIINILSKTGKNMDVKITF